MKVSPHASLVILLGVLLCMVFVSGCTGIPPLKFNSTPPPLITDVQTTVSPGRSAAAPGGGCAEGEIPCSGVCRNTLADAGNCGRCGNICSASQYCSNGVCTAGTANLPVTGITTVSPAGGMTTTITVSGSLCPTGYTPCSGICRNLESDMSNCGRCGNVCGSGRTCSSGACSGGSTITAVTTVPAPHPDAAAAVTTTTNPELLCWSNNIPCAGTCIDPTTDNNNCGGCGNVCTGDQSCIAGRCGCPSGQILCGSACKDTNTNSYHCGSCGNVCPTGYSCSAGTCVPPAPACPPATTLCFMTCVNTATDNANCGYCGVRCPTGSHCSGGICTCDVGIPCGGACTNTATDNDNCGGCGVSCSGGQTCVSGVCTAPATASCPKFQTACPFKGSDICVDLNTDDSNCGSCGNVCTGGTFCSGGICGFVLK
jgi:hypothetical protein